MSEHGDSAIMVHKEAHERQGANKPDSRDVQAPEEPQFHLLDNGCARDKCCAQAILHRALDGLHRVEFLDTGQAQSQINVLKQNPS